MLNCFLCHSFRLRVFDYRLDFSVVCAVCSRCFSPLRFNTIIIILLSTSKAKQSTSLFILFIFVFNTVSVVFSFFCLFHSLFHSAVLLWLCLCDGVAHCWLLLILFSLFRLILFLHFYRQMNRPTHMHAIYMLRMVRWLLIAMCMHVWFLCEFLCLFRLFFFSFCSSSVRHVCCCCCFSVLSVSFFVHSAQSTYIQSTHTM